MNDKRQLISGKPVPEDNSHTQKDPVTGLQKEYVVLSPEERAKGYKKPYRTSYVHDKCGTLTKMHSAISETYARDPYFYSGTYCVGCCAHFDLSEFHWSDGEPMDQLLQEDWAKDQERIRKNRETMLKAGQDMKERAEFWHLAKKHFPDKVDEIMELVVVEGTTLMSKREKARALPDNRGCPLCAPDPRDDSHFCEFHKPKDG
jgi:hypothetical protein